MRDLHRLNPVIDGIAPSATIAISNRAAELKREGVDVVGLGAGEPDFDTPEHIVEAAIRAVREGWTRYTPPDGLPDLKRAIRDKLERENGIGYELDEVAASCGGKHSLHNVFAVTCAPGDEVVIPAPYWVSYPHQVRLAGAEPVVVDTRGEDGFRLDLDALREALTPRTRMIVLNTPSNPTGCVYPREELEALVGLAVERGLLILSDEVYEHLIYGDAAHVSPASLSEEARRHVITMNAVSKTYAMTGWRVGYVGGPRPIVRAVARLQSHQSQNPATPSQAAAIAALDGGLESVHRMREAFQARRDRTASALSEIAGLHLAPPEGAFYAFPDASDLLRQLPAERGMEDATAICAHLLDEHLVACVPGAPFGAPRCFRISFATSDVELARGLERIAEGLAALAGARC